MKLVTTAFVLILSGWAGAAGAAGTDPAGPTAAAEQAPIVIASQDARRVAYLTHTGPYWGVGPRCHEVSEYMRRHGQTGRMFARYLNDPKKVSPSELKIEIGFFVEGDLKIEPPFSAANWSESLVAQMSVKGPFSTLGSQWSTYDQWLAKNGYVAIGPMTEIYPPATPSKASDALTTLEVAVEPATEPVAAPRKSSGEPPNAMPPASEPKTTRTSDGRRSGVATPAPSPSTDKPGDRPSKVEATPTPVEAVAGQQIARQYAAMFQARREAAREGAQPEPAKPAGDGGTSRRHANATPVTSPPNRPVNALPHPQSSDRPATDQLHAPRSTEAPKLRRPPLKSEASAPAQGGLRSRLADRVRPTEPPKRSARSAARPAAPAAAEPPVASPEASGSDTLSSTVVAEAAPVPLAQPASPTADTEMQQRWPDNPVTTPAEPAEPPSPTLGLDELMAAGNYEAVALWLMPEQLEVAAEDEVWFGHTVQRIRALAKAFPRVYPDEAGDLDRLAEALDQRYKVVSSTFALDPMSRPAPQLRSTGPQSKARNELLRDLSTLLVQVGRRSITGVEARNRLVESIGRLQKLLPHGHAFGATHGG